MANTNYGYDISQWQTMGVMPPAFTPELMPEWDWQRGMIFTDGMRELESYCDRVFAFLNDERGKREPRWKLCREYYNMDSKYKQDKERLSSIFADFEMQTDQELNLERASIIHPLVFEAVQEQSARLRTQLLGTGPRYVEVLGREKNDVQGANVYEELASYQQDWLIPTEDIFDDVTNGALVEGTGLVVRTWNGELNCPKDDVPDLTDYWVDPQEAYHYLHRWNIWRRYPTIGEMLRLRSIGFFHFSDDDLKAAAVKRPSRQTTTDNRKKYYPGPKIEPRRRPGDAPLEAQTNRHHEIVGLDIFMQREGVERWVYRANDLIVGVHPNPIPREPNTGIFRYPIAPFTPIRKKGDFYGDSAVYRMLDAQDMVNSISYMMLGNLARTSLGLFFGDPSAYEGSREPRVGEVNAMRDPQNNLKHVTMPDVTGPALIAIQHVKRDVANLISGVKDPSRGEQVSANQTAFSVDRMLEQTQHRIRAMADRGRRFRREYDALGLLLNQHNLQPTEAARVAGQNGVWRPVQGSDLFGVAGKDLMPTGFPVSGSQSFLVQQGMNLVAVLGQIPGANPAPLMQAILEAQFGGTLPIDQMLPQQNPQGGDPVQENEMMAQGLPVQVLPNDDDFRHLQEHVPLFLFLIQNAMDESLVRVVQAHLALHQSRYLQMQAEMGGGEQGMGTSGLNLQIPAPDAKEPGEIEAQMEARNAG